MKKDVLADDCVKNGTNGNPKVQYQGNMRDALAFFLTKSDNRVTSDLSNM